MKSLCYGIIGNGRMAKHFAHYLSLLGIAHRQWCRGQNDEHLASLATHCSPILILINDDAIATFIEQHPCLHSNLLVHFSGNLTTNLAYGAHPLFTFSEKMYPLESYQTIPFICEKNAPSFDALLPGLSNPHFVISREDKSFYHAMCVLSGNFTVMLWKKYFYELEEKLQIPKQYAYPYLQQIMRNILEDSEKALTGPLIRGDVKTIEEHLTALQGDSYQKVYRAFLDIIAKSTDNSTNKKTGEV
jgi:predicted short-subunit dehydrogenase-like oxidoreductase (DUF2520 family)